MTFTPGPWRAPKQDDWRHHCAVVMAGEGDEAIQVACCYDNHVSRATAEANAKLAAAAPDMLAALIDCANDLEAQIEHYYAKTKDHPSERRRYERDMEPVRAARAAIAKATGTSC